MKPKKLFVLHFRPIENYPPIQNFLYLLNEEGIKATCVSTHGSLERKNYTGNIIVKRLGTSTKGKLGLWLAYLWFNFAALFLLIVHRPKQVMYYETLSSLPVFVYVRYINPKAVFYIHYHEYTSPPEYEKASLVERFLHSLENRIYGKATWVSHTNQVRLIKFLQDEKIDFQPTIHQVMPNYPSRKWAQENEAKKKEKNVLKLIYVGYSLTKEGSYLAEVIAFLAKSGLPTELNIYCVLHNSFMRGLNGTHGALTVTVNDAVPYDFLPVLLQQHHVGLILYRAITPNYIYNAPNKLFEYLSCGLDVWYPNEMQGIHEYDTEFQPKVLRLEYNQLEKYNLTELITTTTTQNKFTYFAEDIYARFLIALKKNE